MALRKVEIHVTKYYVLSWIYGLIGFACQYHNNKIIALILYFFCFAYSVADFQTPSFCNSKDNEIEPPDDTNLL